MPHKHKRKRDEDVSNFDLAPNSQAKPLAAYTKASLFTSQQDEPDSKRRKSVKPNKKSKDDTPKAFARMMAWQTTGKRPNGLDEGTTKSKSKTKPTKKQKPTPLPQIDSQTAPPKTASTSTTAAAPAPPSTKGTTAPPSLPKILPGESLSEFSLRVDQTLPLTSIPRSKSTTTPLPADLANLQKSQRTTKHNRRLQRMQSDWRATETQLKEKQAAAQEDMEDQLEEDSLLWRAVHSTRKGKKKKKGTEDDDPWKELEKKRREAKQKNLQDVVKAPPALKKVTSKFKVTREDLEVLDGHTEEDGGALVDVKDVPNKVGSLRRREEMNRARREVIDKYRKMQGRKRGVAERISLAAGARAVVT